MHNTINSIASILIEVSNSSGKQKENILRDNKHNDLLKKTLNLLYNPYIVTNISTKKMSKDLDILEIDTIEDFSGFIEYLKNCTGTNKNIATVKAFIGNHRGCDDNLYWLLDGMACKNLKIGVKLTTINKAFNEEFIPSFSVMLADKWVDYDKKKSIEKENWRLFEGKEVIGTLKIDGNRAEVFVNDDGSIKIYSREGRLVEGCIEIENALINAERGFVYEGEIIATGEFENANERFKKTSSVMRSKGEKIGVQLIVFDAIPIKHFTSQTKTDVSTRERKLKVRELVKALDSEFVTYLEPLFEGAFDKVELDRLAEKLKSEGEEGLMVQLSEVDYEYKRTKNILKYKSFESADLKVVDVYEGLTGKNIGKLGGVICNYKGNLVKVGGGFSDNQRNEYWKEPNKIIGSIVEIKFFEEFLSADGDYDLRFATFKDIRQDKNKESYY